MQSKKHKVNWNNRTFLAVEKDWIVVISGDDNDVLAKMNSVFRTIDLLCLLVAPSLAGSSFSHFIFYGWDIIYVVDETETSR